MKYYTHREEFWDNTKYVAVDSDGSGVLIDNKGLKRKAISSDWDYFAQRAVENGNWVEVSKEKVDEFVNGFSTPDNS